jgi:hypothetical protein
VFPFLSGLPLMAITFILWDLIFIRFAAIFE